MTQSKTFCIAPFTGLQVNANGTLLPCCEFDHQASGFGDIPTFREYDSWQSVAMHQLRQDLLNGVKSPGCHKCWAREEIDSHNQHKVVDSQRMNLNKIFQDFIDSDFDPTRIESPRSVTVMFGNFCNLRCIQCSASCSSSHQTEQLMHKPRFKNLQVYTVDENAEKKWWKTDDFANFLSKINQRIDHVFLHGGEPLITPEAIVFLKSIPNPENVIMTLTTNATSLTDEVYDLLAKFKELSVTVSLEGIGAHNDYLRYGSDWPTVRDNIFRLQQLKNLSFGMVGVNHVLQHTSRLALLPLLEFCDTHNIMLRVGNLRDADHLNVNGMTLEQHQQFLNDLLQAREKYKKNFMISKAVVYSLNFLSTYQYDAEANEKFYKYINLIDSIRGANYVDVFGELDK
jgi:radical SAM protein with 4Fe4S-binding SPASM domain